MGNGSINSLGGMFIQNNNVSLASSISPTIFIKKIKFTIDILETLEADRTSHSPVSETPPQFSVLGSVESDNDNAVIWRHLRRSVPTPPAPIPLPSAQLSLTTTQKIQLVDELLELLDKEETLTPLARELRAHLNNFLELKRIISILKGVTLKPEDSTAATWQRLRAPVPSPLQPVPRNK